jgi:hypothetical protein
MRVVKCVAILAVGLSAISAQAQSSCEVVPLAEVERIFPDYAPWKLSQGGVGACTFEGVVEYEDDSSMTVMLKVNQQFKASSGEASKLIKTLGTAWAATANFTKAPELGAEGFYHQPKTGPKDIISWVAHDDKVVSMGMFMVQGAGPLSKEDQEGLANVIKLALRSSKSKGMAEKAANCPYFDRTLVSKLFENPAAKIEQYGENSCLASAKENKAALVFSRVMADSPAQALMLAKSSAGTGACTVEQAAELGENGTLAYACSSGRPRAELVFVQGNAFIRLSYSAEKEPSANQRKKLLALGGFTRQQLGGK